MLEQPQIESFHQRGLLKLPGFFDPALITPMADHVWTFLEKRDGVQRDKPQSWPAPDKPNNAVRPTKLKPLNTHPIFDGLFNADLLDDLQSLVRGHNVTLFDSAGNRQVLFTYPDAERWELPHSVWHSDLPHPIGHHTPQGLQLFICLEELLPGGGATLVLAGSHIAMQHQMPRDGRAVLPSADYKKWLARESDYVAALFNAKTPNRNDLLNMPGSFAGVALQPVELTGAPGDLYIMDMRCLHTLAPNAQSRPRIMITQRFQVAPT